jgi:hypothetical protein
LISLWLKIWQSQLFFVSLWGGVIYKKNRTIN